MKRFLVFFISLFCITLSMHAQQGYTLSGKITDDTHNPLPGANVYIPDLQVGDVAGQDGMYRLENLKQGWFKIQISFVGYETVTKDILIQDQDLKLDVELHGSAFLSQEVVISGGRPSSQHENAIKIETIKPAAIRSEGNPSIMQSIAAIPGVAAISKGFGVTTPVIRGLSTSNILVLNNGIRLENYQFSAEHPYLVDEFGIEQVEVIKGPASLLYGSDAIGGVMNFIGEKPANAGTIEGDANLQYHSNTNGFAGNLGIKGSGKKFSWGLRGGVKSHMDYLQGSGEFVPNSRFNQASIKSFGGLTTKIGVYRIYYDYVKLKAGMSVLPAIMQTTDKGRKNEIWYQDLDMHMVASRNSFYFRKFKLHANLAYQFNHRRLKGDEPGPHFTLVDARLQTVNYELKSSITTSHRSNFILAIQGMFQQNKNQEAPEHVLPDYSLNDIAISGLVQHDFNRLHFQLGFRFDNRLINIPEQERHAHGHEEEGHEEEEEEEELLPELSRYYGNLSGSFGLTYDLAEHFLFRANLASAYRSPSIAELTQDGAHGVRYEQGNRDLKSQRNYEADISVHYHSNRWLFDLAGYYNYILDYIFLSPTTDTTDEGQTIYRYLQSDASIYGLEAVAEWLVLPEFSIKGNYTFTRGQQSNGDGLPFIPQNRVTLEIKWLSKELWKLSNFYIKAGSGIAFDQIHPAPFESNTGGYTIFNSGLGFSIKTSGGPIQFDIIATNLFNKQYIDHLSTLKELGYQDPGRNVMVSVTVPFGTSD